MSHKTLIPSKVTRDSKKGQRILDLTGAMINKLGLDEDQAQRVIENPEFPPAIEAVLRTYAMPNEYADEEVSSSYTYPPEYRKRTIKEQVERLLVLFPNLKAEWALTQGQQWYDGLTLPKWVEGPLVYPWWEVFGGYHATLAILLKKLAESRRFYNYREGQLGEAHLRQTELTARLERQLKAIQPGDLLIVPSQAGFRFRGKSVRRGRVLYEPNEFGLGSVAEAARALTHPDRYVRFEELDTDCAGDEYSPDSVGQFHRSPYFRFIDGEFRFGSRGVGCASGYYGSASGFFPPE